MSRRDKIKADEKVRIAKAYTQGKIGLREAAKQIGVHHTVIEDWVRLYETEGAQAFLPRARNRRYDPVLKEAAVKDYLSGKGSIRTICRKYKIRDTKQLRTWIKVYNSHKDFKKQTGGSRMTKGREKPPKLRKSQFRRHALPTARIMEKQRLRTMSVTSRLGTGPSST